jgi:uncharacterized membrane protein YdjX (TVP38/TMEM64 family)
VLALGLMITIFLNRDDINPEAFHNPLRELGFLGMLLFLLIFCVLQPLYVSVYVFIGVATLTWEPITAFILSYIGVLGSGLTSFAFSRYLAQDWARSKIPAGIMKYDEQLDTKGFQTVFLLRILFYTTPIVQMFLGISRVRYGPFLAGTAIGILPTTLIVVFLGSSIITWLGSMM